MEPCRDCHGQDVSDCSAQDNLGLPVILMAPQDITLSTSDFTTMHKFHTCVLGMQHRAPGVQGLKAILKCRSYVRKKLCNLTKSCLQIIPPVGSLRYS